MTLEPEAQIRIDDIVGTWVGEGRMFTAFEVSLEVKRQGVTARHRNMRDYIHDSVFRAASNVGYTRTLVEVGAPDPAWVYHPVYADPATYVPLDRSQYGPTRASKPGRVLHKSSLPQGAFGTDRRGRLCIPVRLLATLGVRSGQRVSVRCDPATGTVMIKRAGAAWANPDTNYTTEGHGNVRLAQGILTRAGLNGQDYYRVDGDDDVITISKFD
jgi:bifunctional DNA-binding transcriptional regulator/antitoxin component of YhaV-PrlF toxin-antitoxin module